MFRDILDKGGRPELVQRAGRRALDLAEAAGDPMELVDLAVQRTIRQPEAQPPRGFLLEALDRVPTADIERWLEGDPSGDRHDALRRPLILTVSRGSVGARLRAAEHLGRLRLPDTAVALARTAESLSAPREATATVRSAYERARLAALRAAGSLGDPAAVPILERVMNSTATAMPARRTAAWGLARTGTKAGADALAPYIQASHDPPIAALGCLALAAQARTRVDKAHGIAAANLAQQSRSAWVRHACAYAEAALTSDRQAKRLRDQLRSSDPMRAAIAAWRLGRVERTERATIEALVGRYIGPPGLARDAAGAALARLLASEQSSEDPRADATTPPAVHQGSWERWLRDKVAPAGTALAPSALEQHANALAAALERAHRGTRAEREAARKAVEQCGAYNERAVSICLAPLVRGPVRLPPKSARD